jgi:hypothetical protein
LYSLQKEPTASSGLTRRLRGGGTLRVVSDPDGGAAGAVSDPGGEIFNSDSPDLSTSGDEKKTSELSQSPTERSVSFAPVIVAASNGGAAAESDGGVAAAASNGDAAASNGGVAVASDGGESVHGDYERS